MTAGRITFAGEDISHAGRARRRRLSRDLQVVFQDPYSSLNPAMEIGEILAEWFAFAAAASNVVPSLKVTPVRRSSVSSVRSSL